MSKQKHTSIETGKMFSFGKAFLICSAVLTVFVASVYGLGPLHASCKLTWEFDMNCTAVNTALVTQIKKWTSADNCKQGGEKCLYKLSGSSASQIKATHTTPVKKYVDDLEMDFKQSDNHCTVEGKSSSETWYAVLDYGTNYCNLHNLLTGAKLDTAKGFKENTSNSICTQYLSADCEKY